MDYKATYIALFIAVVQCPILFAHLRYNMARYKAWFLGFGLYTKLLDSILNFLLHDYDDGDDYDVCLSFRQPQPFHRT